MKQRGSIAIALLVLPPLLLPLILQMQQGGTRDGFALALVVGWLFVSIPVSILVFLDWYRWAAAIGLGRGVRNVARLPIFLFGVTAVLIGLGVLAWIAYRLLIDGRSELGWTAIEAAGVMVSIITFGTYLIRLSLWNPDAEQR
jgi:hypothetical protein